MRHACHYACVRVRVGLLSVRNLPIVTYYPTFDEHLSIRLTSLSTGHLSTAAVAAAAAAAAVAASAVVAAVAAVGAAAIHRRFAGSRNTARKKTEHITSGSVLKLFFLFKALTEMRLSS